MNARASRGLSLIGVLVALSVLSISMLALVPLFGMSVKTNASSGQLATANSLAREKLEQLICYPSTDARLLIPSGQTVADSTNNTYCANDLPKWWNPATGVTSTAATSPGNGWFPFPCTRTYTVRAFKFAPITPADPTGGLSTAQSSTASPDESIFSGINAVAPYYDVKLVTVTVQPAGSPFPGLRRTVQSAYVKFRTP